MAASNGTHFPFRDHITGTYSERVGGATVLVVVHSCRGSRAATRQYRNAEQRKTGAGLKTPRRTLSILVPWLMLRILLSMVALGASSARPNTSLEQSVKVWPVSSPRVAWVKRG